MSYRECESHENLVLKIRNDVFDRNLLPLSPTQRAHLDKIMIFVRHSLIPSEHKKYLVGVKDKFSCSRDTREGAGTYAYNLYFIS